MLWAFWPSHANIKRESTHILNIIFRTLNSVVRTPLSRTWLYQTPVIFHWTHFSVNYCWLSQTVSIHFSWEFQIAGFSKIIWDNWLTLCNVHFRSWLELTKSDAVNGMFWAKVSKKNDWGNVHGVKHTIKPRGLCASHRN